MVSKNSIRHIVVGGCLTVRNCKTYPTVILANATHRMWEMSRDAYMDVSGSATQEAKAGDSKSEATSIQ